LGSNALILPAGKTGSSGREPKEQQQEQQLSKSQLKKLRQVQLKKERRQQLSEVRLWCLPAGFGCHIANCAINASGCWQKGECSGEEWGGRHAAESDNSSCQRKVMQRTQVPAVRPTKLL
jgi:hypothetical protein